jgi:hypothetical protein
MSGGIVQLVATGAQDTWLTGKPEVSFYRASYKRYTHYAMSSERQLIQGAPAAGNISTIRFEKKGDLLNYIYFTAKDTSGALIPGVDWSKVIEKIDLLIGGQIVDTQDITWMTQVEPVTGAQNYSQRYLNNDTDGLTNVINGFLPLKFFFCKDWNVSLPLVALQYHDVELRITWNANLNYRVGYETYTTGTPTSVPNIGTALSTANPVTTATLGTGIGACQMTISSTNNTANSPLQTTPFSYSGANFQLVPGMRFYPPSGTGNINGSGTTLLHVLSVTPTNSTSGTFIGTYNVPPTSGALAPTVVNVQSTPYNTADITLTTASGAAFGAPALIQNDATTGAGSALTHTYTMVTIPGGYPTIGMTVPAAPGATGTGYVSAVALNAGAINTFDVSYAVATAATTPSGAIFGLSAPPTTGSISASLTYASGGAGSSSQVVYTVTGGLVAGSIYPGMQVAAGQYAAGMSAGYVAVVTYNTSAITGMTISYLTTQAVSSGTAQTVVFTPTAASAVVTAATSGSASTRQWSYTAVTVASGSYLYLGMSVSGLPGTSGTGYISALGSTSYTVQQAGSTTMSIYYPSAVPTDSGALANVTFLAPLGSVQSTAASGTTVTNVPIYGLGGASSPLFIPVNSVIKTTLPFLTGESSTVKNMQVTSIQYFSGGVALATLTAIGAAANGAVTTAPSFTGGIPVLQTATVLTPYYPIVNLCIAAAPTNIAVGQSMLGAITLTNRPIPSVSNVYGAVSGGYIISIKTNSVPLSGSTGATPALSTINGYYNSTAVQFSFVPSSYFVGIITGGSTALSGSGTFASSGTNTTSTDAISQTVVNGVATAIAPPLGTYFYTTASTTTNGGGTAQNPSNPYVASTSISGSIAVTYIGTATTTAYLVNSQFALVPQGQIQATTSTQPYVDREGSAILSLTNIYSSSSTPLSVGLAVTGTQYTGPVTVSQVISLNAAGANTALIEINFPQQSQNVNTNVTGIQFIDPSQPLNPGVTVSTTGFNGTYAQLQYEAWTNFVYLDQAEREFFANTPMDMLITQITRIPIATANMQELALAHPVKFLAFLSNNYTTAYQNQATTGIPASSYYFKTQINGVDVGDSRSLFQWQDVPHYYHTPFGYKAAGSIAPVGLITYCLDTSKLQPTGTLNFSRIDTYRIVAPAGMNLTTISGGNGNYFYAMNYNVLRIKDGMSGLLYSN